ncbi:MAG: exodeoxyribonuclease V subunit beta [Candidatus Dasytiphilus stammeri]
MIKNKILKPLTLSLYGKILIEASAGTGKTYTISILYLRLLLGLRQPGYKSTPLTVEEILVVTFTEAATLELKNIIRKNIHDLRLACVWQKSENPDLMGILSQIDDLRQATALLLIAELNIETTGAIYTIHSFCQRMLYLNGIRPGGNWEINQFLENDSLIQESIMEFWHRHCSGLPLSIAKELAKEWAGPEQLLHTLLPLFRQDAPILKPKLLLSSTLTEEYHKILSQIGLIKKQLLVLLSDLHPDQSHCTLFTHCKNNNFSIFFHKIYKWTQQNTYNCSFPKEFFFLRKKVLYENNSDFIPSKHLIFDHIEKFFLNTISLREWIIGKAFEELPSDIKRIKNRRSILTFDDLLYFLDDALHQDNGNYLAKEIRDHYSVALIDEFQDTDYKQYRIFNTVYNNHADKALILIGDPKQAIYSFRGADVFTYIQSVNSITKRYNLNINWRSSSTLVKGINQLFSQIENPFLLPNIPFIPVQSSDNNYPLRIIVNQQKQVPLRFCLQPGLSVNISEYQYFMARYCASDILKWIRASKNNQVQLIESNQTRNLKASDLVILVRNRNEAVIMQNALSYLKIDSIYLSSENNLEISLETYEILVILKAVLIPEQSKWLYAALSTRIFNLDIINLKKNINHNNLLWKEYMNKFNRYKRIWIQYGILSMFRDIVHSSLFSQTFLFSSNEDKPRINNYFHIIEVLQEMSSNLDSKYALVHWLEQQINKSKNKIIPFSERRSLENDNDLIKIISIHKSKGLQYPVVWIPFMAYFRQENHSIYHDRVTFEKIFDLRNEEESVRLSYEERLAEDLRLLYVALTRSIWHCSIGIAPLIKGTRRKREGGNTDLHHSALGYLLQRGQPQDAQCLRSILNKIQNENIEVIYAEDIDTSYSNTTFGSDQRADQLQHSVIIKQNLNTYCHVNNVPTCHHLGRGAELFPYIENEEHVEMADTDNNNIELPIIKSPHTFPRGIKSNIFLHSLLEQLDFTQITHKLTFKKHLDHSGIDISWSPFITKWINDILNFSLGQEEQFSLNKIFPQNKQISWKFSLKIDSIQKLSQLDQLIHFSAPLSACGSTLYFHQFQGLLTGLIDLIVKWKDKYYLIDYKTHWLGKDQTFYTSDILQSIITTNHYEWCSHLYTLALHRYLRDRLQHYNYNKNFGGVYYLFLRGMSANNSDPLKKNGIWRHLPKIELITTLDNFFTNK